MDSTQLEALLNGPALAPPPGVTPQLNNPPSYRAATTAIPTVCLIVATLAVSMRVYTRARIIRVVNIADCTHLDFTVLFQMHINIIIDSLILGLVHLPEELKQRLY